MSHCWQLIFVRQCLLTTSYINKYFSKIFVSPEFSMNAEQDSVHSITGGSLGFTYSKKPHIVWLD